MIGPHGTLEWRMPQQDWPPLYLRIIAGAARRPTLFPQFFPIPNPVLDFVRQGESQLDREHAHLPPMVGFVTKHVAQHFGADRPRLSPAVSAKLRDAAPAERF